MRADVSLASRRRFLLSAGAGTLALVAPVQLLRAAQATSITARLRGAAGISIPDTELSGLAADMCRSASPEFLFNHCVRTYLFGALAAKKRSYQLDFEAVLIAALLHDLGLVERYQTRNAPFEIDGADAAKRFLVEHGVDKARAEIVWDAIAMHTSDIASHKAAEIRVVAFGAGTDVFGGGISFIGQDAVTDVLSVYPRLGFNQGFQNLLISNCAHKGSAQTGTWTDEFCRAHPNDGMPKLSDAFKSVPFRD